MDLSQKRADSVRTYLVGRGIPSEIIRAVGIGPDRPVADNGSAEGRANNRRVEIIVSPAERK
jgi:outer membrane protein OmpA-like peptidoglycan-associated protein